MDSAYEKWERESGRTKNVPWWKLWHNLNGLLYKIIKTLKKLVLFDYLQKWKITNIFLANQIVSVYLWYIHIITMYTHRHSIDFGIYYNNILLQSNRTESNLIQNTFHLSRNIQSCIQRQLEQPPLRVRWREFWLLSLRKAT
jgi:hypothetical protein